MLRFSRFYGHSVLRSRLDSGSVVIDLGANRGAFASAIWKVVGCKPYCAEPNPSLCNGLAQHPGLRAFKVAIGPHSGRVRFKLADNDECSTLLDLPASAAKSEIECEALTLADFLDRIGVARVDLLKIDIEGAELDLLAQVEPSLWARIDQVAVEFHETIGFGTVQDVHERICRLEGFGFQAVKVSLTNFRDVLFVHPGRLGLAPGWEWQARAWRLSEGCGRRLRSAWKGCGVAGT